MEWCDQAKVGTPQGYHAQVQGGGRLLTHPASLLSENVRRSGGETATLTAALQPALSSKAKAIM